MNYKGDYVAGTTYSVGDVVVFTDHIPYQMIEEAAAGTTCHEKRCWKRLDSPLAEVVVLLHDMLKEGGNEGISAMIAPEYSKKTYSKNDIVIHSGKLYKAKQNIGTAENWTEAHWDEITIGGQLSALNTAAATIPTNISDEAITLASGDNDYLITVDASGEDPELVVTKDE